MPISSHLLERAYQLINANQIQNAELVLDAVVRVNPQNIEAWIIYLQIHQNRSDLEWLKDRILRTRELNEQDKQEILQYHDALIQHLAMTEAGSVEAHPGHVFNVRPGQKVVTQGENTLFELIDVFDYPAIKNEPATRKRARRRRWLGISLMSPATQAIALLFLFFTGIRLLTLEYSFGYVLLVLFVAGCMYWLSNHKNQKPIPMDHNLDPARMYFLDSKSKLTLTDKTVVDTKRRSRKTPKL